MIIVQHQLLQSNRASVDADARKKNLSLTSARLTKDKVARTKQLTNWTGANGVHGARFCETRCSIKGKKNGHRNFENYYNATKKFCDNRHAREKSSDQRRARVEHVETSDSPRSTKTARGTYLPLFASVK
jgi:hypothetical protein